MGLHGKIALVTGAGSGIGRATALLFAGHGAHVVLLDLSADAMAETAGEIAEGGGSFVTVIADVADEEQMRSAIREMMQAVGRLDIVVVNAGINGVWAPIDDLSPREWDETVAVNLRGTYLTLHLTVPHLKAAGGGSIIVIASINGTRTFTTPGATAYTATKAAQVAMVQQLALELGKWGIRINAICPGEITTNIPASTFARDTETTEVPVEWPEGDIPLTHGRPGESIDVAEVALFLASDHARHVTGSPIWVDGGQGLLR